MTTAGPTIETFDFHGDKLDVIRGDSVAHVVIKRVCEALGVRFNGQLEKLQSDPSVCVQMIWTQVPGDDQRREFACLAIRALPLWLATIHPGKVKTEATRAKLIRYKRDCADVLADHFLGKRGAAPLPAPAEPAHQSFNMESLARVLTTAIDTSLAPFSARLAAIEASHGFGAGIVGRSVAKSICTSLAKVASIQVRCGQAKSLRSARTRLENALRGSVGWAGTGCSWDRLPTAKHADVLRELHVLTKTADGIESGLNLRKQTSLRLVPITGTT